MNHGKVSHKIGRPRVVDRQQPRKSKRDSSQHHDKYTAQRKTEGDLLAAMILDLAAHFNGEEADHE